jgi:hypothetical protein
VIDTRGDDVTRGWSLRLLAGLVAASVVLSGCSEKQQANDSLPSAGASPTEEELPPLGPEDLPMPAEARTQDAAGAEAFVRYYIDLINRTSETLNSDPLRQLSDGCSECNRIADDAERDQAAGYRYEGGELLITEVGDPLVDDTTAEVPFRADLAPLTVLDGSGEPVPDLTFEAFPDLLSNAALRWDSSSWSWVITQLNLG